MILLMYQYYILYYHYYDITMILLYRDNIINILIFLHDSIKILS